MSAQRKQRGMTEQSANVNTIHCYNSNWNTASVRHVRLSCDCVQTIAADPMPDTACTGLSVEVLMNLAVSWQFFTVNIPPLLLLNLQTITF